MNSPVIYESLIRPPARICLAICPVQTFAAPRLMVGDGTGNNRSLRSASFVRADFRGARISGAIFSGNCSSAQFAGAQLRCCELAGTFDGASDLGPAINSCVIHPEASFKGVDLWETPPARLDMKTGHTVNLLGKRFELLRPAQWLKCKIRPDSSGGSYDAEQCTLNSSLVAGSILGRADAPFLYDIAGLATELHGQGYVGGPYFLHAPGVTLKAFNSKDLVQLVGNFAQAFVKDSEFFMLVLKKGSFVDFDLTGAQIKMLILEANNIDVAGLRIPSSVGLVHFRWISRSTETSFSTDAATAELVIKVWNSAGACEALAKYLLNRSQKPVNLKILASKGQTVSGVAGSPNSTSDAVCCGLIARRNQLLFRPRFLRPKSFAIQGKPVSASPPKLRSIAAEDEGRNI